MGQREPDEYDEYYRRKLATATEFQDYVAWALYRKGIPLVNFQSRKWQHDIGENIIGIEIKHDERRAETGNLYIEVAEKAHPSNVNYVASGIYRDDNSWLYAIGDRTVFYVFSKTMLKHLHRSGRYREPLPTPTSKGFLLPEVDARKFAALMVKA